MVFGGWFFSGPPGAGLDRVHVPLCRSFTEGGSEEGRKAGRE